MSAWRYGAGALAATGWMFYVNAYNKLAGASSWWLLGAFVWGGAFTFLAFPPRGGR